MIASGSHPKATKVCVVMMRDMSGTSPPICRASAWAVEAVGMQLKKTMMARVELFLC